MALLSGPCYEPKSGGAPDSLVIMLHGLGSSGDDLIQLASFWGENLPNTIFYSPNAPQPFDQAPFGFQWFSRRDEETRKNGVQAVISIVNGYVDELLEEHHLEPRRCIQVGFSQGSIVSLHTVHRRENPLGGLVAFSGLMPTGDSLKDEITNKTPALLVHGEQDSVLPSSHSIHAGKVLTELDVPNEVNILPNLGHSIDARGIELSTRFMERIFSVH